jgi:hypothetical protein
MVSFAIAPIAQQERQGQLGHVHLNGPILISQYFMLFKYLL